MGDSIVGYKMTNVKEKEKKKVSHTAKKSDE